MLAAGLKVYCMSNADLRAQGSERRRAAGAMGAVGAMLGDRGVVPPWGPNRETVEGLPSPGESEPTEREVLLYVTGDPTRIQGARSANLTD